jgi:hypothetical protein
VAACGSTAATTGFVRGHRAPVTTNNRRVHRDTQRRCARMCKRSNLPPVFQGAQSSLPRAPINHELDRPGCDNRLPRRDMSFATSVDTVVLTRCVQHLPPWPLTCRPHESTRTKTSQPASQCRMPESLKPTHLATTTTAVNRGSCSQYSNGGSSASPRSQRDDIYDSRHTPYKQFCKRLGRPISTCPSCWLDVACTSRYRLAAHHIQRHASSHPLTATKPLAR